MYIFIFQKIQDDSLEENLHLAQEYQKLQNVFLTVKDNYFNQYEKQLSHDGSIRDKKQVGFSYFSKIMIYLTYVPQKVTSSQSWGLQSYGGLLYATKWHVFVLFYIFINILKLNFERIFEK